MLNEHEIEGFKGEIAGLIKLDEAKAALEAAEGTDKEDEMRTNAAAVIEAIGRMMGGEHVEKSKLAAAKIRNGNPKTDEQKARNCIAELRDMAHAYRTNAEHLEDRYLGGTALSAIPHRTLKDTKVTELEMYFMPTTAASKDDMAIGRSNTPKFTDFLLSSALSFSNSLAIVFRDEANKAEAFANSWEAELDAAQASKVVKLGA